MKYRQIRNVDCWGSLHNADCLLVSTCMHGFTISPKSTWEATVNYLLKDDEYMQKCAKRGELQIEVA